MISYGLTPNHLDASLPAVKSITELCPPSARKRPPRPPGEWIIGRGYDDNKLDERRHPTGLDLDQATADHPVMIVNGSGHLAAVNCVALQLAGVTRNTADPVGGHFVRDEHGDATGVLDETAQEPIRA